MFGFVYVQSWSKELMQDSEKTKKTSDCINRSSFINFSARSLIPFLKVSLVFNCWAQSFHFF